VRLPGNFLPSVFFTSIGSTVRRPMRPWQKIYENLRHFNFHRGIAIALLDRYRKSASSFITVYVRRTSMYIVIRLVFFLVVLPWLSSFGNPCPDCPVKFSLSYSDCPIKFWLICPGCPVRYGCLVQVVQFWLFCNGSPIQAFLSLLPVLAVMSRLFCKVVPVMFVL
jgi:hypothetical protein